MGARRSLPLALLVLAAAGCPGGGAHDGAEADQALQRGGGRRGITEPLGEPPPADPAAPGASYIGALYGRFRPRWSAFLEDCRTRLARDHVLNDAALEAVLAIAIDRSGQLIDVGLEEEQIGRAHV